MGEGPEAADSPGERWGMRRRNLTRSLLSQEKWKGISCPDDHLRIEEEKKKGDLKKDFNIHLVCSFAGSLLCNQPRQPGM